ncbi:MAG: AIR synthase family protein [Clostridiales bacterium]|nr:AIR synthase family protein [Clostridiales bacterium]
MKKGKLDNETLKRLVLGRTGAERPEVVVGPGIGEDCAVIDFGEYECVLSTDPITASASRIGSLAVHIACNDVASNGVEPLAVMLTVLLPPETTEDEISEIARQADEAAKGLGVQIVGGHTEVTDVVRQPLVSATAIGRSIGSASCLRHSTQSPALTQPNTLIVVTKQLALEGTAIAAERCEANIRSLMTDEEIGRAKAMMDRISVVKEGVIAGRLGIRAMHDITEGGILGAVWEACAREGVGAELTASALPFAPETLALCAVLDLDPMRLISSGSMLMFVPAEKWGALSAALSEADIPATVIGRVLPPEDGLTLIMKNGEREPIAPPGPDEIYKI